MSRRPLPPVLTAALLALSCSGGGGTTVLVVNVEIAHRPAEEEIVLLKTTVEDATHSVTRDYPSTTGRPIRFPTSFAIELSREVTGPLRIDVRGLDAAHVVRVRGTIEELRITPGREQSRRLYLECASGCPGSDAGVRRDAAPDATSRDAGLAGDVPDRCGNGEIDPGETCDVAIPAGKPGACPPASCDDGIPCTVDTRTGSRCTAQCNYTEIRTFVPGDRCCPAGGTHMTDPDCSATCGNGTIEPGETCDRAIPPGRPGACPLAVDCTDGNPCTMDILISAGTCSARCVHHPIVAFVTGDGCCPAGATHTTDSDCPAACGNGIVEPGETCDLAFKAPDRRACACSDGDPCTVDMLEGSGCRTTCKFVPITEYRAGDGCCPRGGNRNVDADCPAVCGNGVVEPGETCDKAIAAGRPGACPTACPGDPSMCVSRTMQGSVDGCSARCVTAPITACSRTQKDGCCPMGCSTGTDADCSPTCGNGIVEPGETCDTAIPDGTPGSCPRRCDDRFACTADSLVSGGTCNARCQHTPITAFMAGDGCCPPGGNANVDPDCPPVCGNAVVEPPKESCDRAIPAGMPGSCPSSCPPPAMCRKAMLRGETSGCTARCESVPITECEPDDGCCPMGCNRNNDPDCPAVCGNGVLEMGEACDKGITAGMPGACPASCDDNNPCTSDSTSGRVEDCTRTCTYAPVTACAAGDRCCPMGCNEKTDSDCAPVCGNGVVEKDETCDPPSSCPTTCADDGDSCTTDKLMGSPTNCTAVCTHTPITTCAKTTADGCCPTGCTNATDADCPAAPGSN